jgi:uncharacterized surface protein with fasciclin (FAS1) repeats
MKSDGPFTVFAPSDEAFAKLPEGLVAELLKDQAKLSSILTYHVLAGAVPASVVGTLNGKEVKTVNGAEVKVSVDSSGVKVGTARVVSTDIMCDNGIIHVIDSVLLPPGLSIPTVSAQSVTSEADKRVLKTPRQAQWFPMLLSPKALGKNLRCTPFQ